MEKVKVAIVIREKVDFRARKIAKNTDRPFIVIKKSINQK